MAERAAIDVFYCGLSLSLFFAFTKTIGFLGLLYNVGYELYEIGPVILSEYADSTIWVAVTSVTVVAAMSLAAWRTGRERLCWFCYCIMAFTQVAFFIFWQTSVVFWFSLILGIVFLAATAILARRLRMQTQPEGTLMVISSFIVIATFLESSALIPNLLALLNPNLLASQEFWSNIAALQSQFSGLLFTYSPILMLAAIFAWIPMLPLVYLKSVQGAGDQSELKEADQLRGSRVLSLTLLAFALGVAVVIPLLPYVNDVSHLHGVDAEFYHDQLLSLTSLSDAVHQLGVEPRAPYLLLLYMVKQATGWDAFQITIVGPVIPAILFTVAGFLLAYQLTRDRLAAGIAAFLAASSLHMAVGLFAGIYANWLALTVVMLFFYLFDKSLSEKRWTLIVLAILASYLLAFVHAWTWGITVAAILVLLTLMVLGLFLGEDRKDLRNSLRTCIIVASLCTIPLLVIMFGFVGALPGLREATYQELYLAVGSFSLNRLGHVLATLSFTLDYYVGALFAYPSLLLLASIGGLSMAWSQAQHARSLIAWVLVSSVSAVLLDSSFQWRALYLIPFEVFSAAGAVFLLTTIDQTERKVPSLLRKNWMLIIKILLLLVVLIDALNYALRAVAILP